ncbi:hypothetical protein DCAR_0520886 [Daucus carota subsp. sativus]|uniref:WD repeat-containing protein 6 n=2 Tax=Daucus carota subsp. sativus TaxID=79200 RepID=A0AAF0X6R1_DAUCS|nr:PREDICTED: uncharacterized protein LOC108223445 isoform X1 [Daucus carota subsp. sativus]WOH01502.1 hypothetical protein DCAR_0520886 [Daucus carota subsp. sativus]
MEDSKKKECQLKRGEYLGEISALCLLHPPSHLSSLPYLLSGTGSQILFYDLHTGNMIKSFQVFEGIRVHGISCTVMSCTEGTCISKLDFKIAVFGERRVKLFSLHIDIASNMQNQAQVSVDLILHQSLPKFNHWVLDVCFLEDATSSSSKGKHYLAIGCSDNTVCIWDMTRSSSSFEVKSPERCLLYSMKMWGEQIEALHIASGTIFNEIIVWKVVFPNVSNPGKELVNLTSLDHAAPQHHFHQLEAIAVCRLGGHEGSIFNIAWSSNGSKLVSVSDDRSARIWTIHVEKEGLDICHSIGPVLFGHTARVWDCCIVDSFIITAGEDCTCRVWGVDGIQLKVIKEHVGRGVWRCLYDPCTSLLVTAGFDSAVKVHNLHTFEASNSDRSIQLIDNSIHQKDLFSFCIPNSSGHAGLTDSKSEYVRCLQFTREDTLYIATNNGFLYHAKLFDTGEVKWTKLLQSSGEAPIVCMNLLTKERLDLSSGIEDWVSVGDGKGYVTIVKVLGDVSSPKLGLTYTWSAESERQLLGTFWCKSLGYRFIFTADPRGKLKLWRFSEPFPANSHCSVGSSDVCLVAEFVSSFSRRIMCLDASLEEEVLVCGDLHGNLVLFPLGEELVLGTSTGSESKISPSVYFKGAHGISGVCRVIIALSGFGEVNICSTGGDGCICYMEYDRDKKKLQFTGMKQVKELSMVQSVSYKSMLDDDSGSGNYAVGFASADFIIWNLITETKVVQIPCGGWRRPNSYFLGDLPELRNCFAYVKDEIIYVHRHWVPDSERKIYPQNLHLQFHGREMHSLCFISGNTIFPSTKQQGFCPNACWLATGCEDGTVRLTRYDPGLENWTASKLLGEHVGGSAVRSICCVSKMNLYVADSTTLPSGMILEDVDSPLLLISVGAKRVLTAWKQNLRKALPYGEDNKTKSDFSYKSELSTSMPFKWLSTDMPIRSSNSRGNKNNTENMDSVDLLGDKYENDWRYLAVTAFLVKSPDSRISVCFVVVACSDATVALRALILPYRLWFDVALLVPLASPVLSLQHVIIPNSVALNENIQIGSQYIALGGSTDGSITFWDLTRSVQACMQRVSALKMEDFNDCQKRPRTGRGSQGGRWWRSLGSIEKPGDSSGSLGSSDRSENGQSHSLHESSSACPQRSKELFSQVVDPAFSGSETSNEDSSLETCEIRPLHTVENVHQSGVNCLHVSGIKDNTGPSSGFLFYVISGGDDQALHSLRFDVSLLQSVHYTENANPDRHGCTESETSDGSIYQCQKQNYSIKLSCHEKILSAHSSAVKGVWTDGIWVFSTGLDQRVRCWHLEEDAKLTEHCHLVISVPEPETLDARACSRNQHYQIAIAGRGMQMVEFFAPGGMSAKVL